MAPVKFFLPLYGQMNRFLRLWENYFWGRPMFCRSGLSEFNWFSWSGSL